MVIDGFLDTFDSLRAYADDAKFGDEDVEGVVYPLICRHIPTAIREEILQRLAVIMGRPLVRPIMFMRLSPEGVHCPNQVHADNSMGDYSLMLYLNRPEHCQGGTAKVRHKETGIGFAPQSGTYADYVHNSRNNMDEWEPVEAIPMWPNRAFLFPANTLHRADPVGGFGSNNEDARLVLTVFFI